MIWSEGHRAAYTARITGGVDPVEVASILCAGVTVYVGLKVNVTRPVSAVVADRAVVDLESPRESSGAPRGDVMRRCHETYC